MRKFAIFNTKEFGFYNADGNMKNDLLNSAIFTEETAKEHNIDLTSKDIAIVQMTQEMWDSLPSFDMVVDTAPDVPFDVEPSEELGEQARNSNFAAMHFFGFYCDKFNQPKIFGFDSTRMQVYNAKEIETIAADKSYLFSGNYASMLKQSPTQVLIPFTDEQVKQISATHPELTGSILENAERKSAGLDDSDLEDLAETDNLQQ